MGGAPRHALAQMTNLECTRRALTCAVSLLPVIFLVLVVRRFLCLSTLPLVHIFGLLFPLFGDAVASRPFCS